MATLFDYLPNDTQTVRIGALHQALEKFWGDVATRYESLRHDRRKPILAPEKLFVRTEELFSELKPYGSIDIRDPDTQHPRLRPLPDVTFDAKADDPCR
jgi:transcription-repair coupling factor (superfamily II helicase)